MREDFELDGHQAFVIPAAKPGKAASGRPWVWYAPTLGWQHPGQTEAWMFDRLGAQGIAIAGVDVGESYGSPAGRAPFQNLYVQLTLTRAFNKKPVLLARSRGGLMLYNWAAEHPDRVAGIAGIYPVCNLLSYPGLDKAAPTYGLTPGQLEDQLANYNPIDRLAPLASAGVPIFHLHGDADEIVPLEDNTALLAERYKKLGGPVTVEVIKGGGHDLESHWFQSQSLTDFMITRALAGDSEENA